MQSVKSVIRRLSLNISEDADVDHFPQTRCWTHLIEHVCNQSAYNKNVMQLASIGIACSDVFMFLFPTCNLQIEVPEHLTFLWSISYEKTYMNKWFSQMWPCIYRSWFTGPLQPTWQISSSFREKKQWWVWWGLCSHGCAALGHRVIGCWFSCAIGGTAVQLTAISVFDFWISSLML